MHCLLRFVRLIHHSPADLVDVVALHRWALAPTGLFYEGSDQVMVTHTERHEAFVEWDQYHRYNSMDTTPRPMASCAHRPTINEAFIVGNGSKLDCVNEIEGATCRISCAPDYAATATQTSNDVSCEFDATTGDGQWTAVDLVCDPLTCSLADLVAILGENHLDSNVEFANVTQCFIDAGGSFSYNDSCPLQCSPGYAIDGHKGIAAGVVTCDNISVPNADIQFSLDSLSRELASSCSPISGYCAQVNPVDDAMATSLGLLISNSTDCSSTSHVGGSCRLFCPEGGDISIALRCEAFNQTHGVWSGVPATFNCDGNCERIDYAFAELYGRGNCSQDQVSPGEVCELDLLPGYRCQTLNGSLLVGNKASHTVTCQPGANWPLACDEIEEFCSEPGESQFEVEHGTVQCTGQKLGSICTLLCDVGFSASELDAGTNVAVGSPLIGNCTPGDSSLGVWTVQQNLICSRIQNFCPPSLPSGNHSANSSAEDWETHLGWPTVSEIVMPQTCSNASFQDVCSSFCDTGYMSDTVDDRTPISAGTSPQLANTYQCSMHQRWELLSLSEARSCVRIPNYCPSFPSQQLSDPNAYFSCQDGSEVYDECAVTCLPGFQMNSATNQSLSTFCDPDTAEWTIIPDFTCSRDDSFCPNSAAVLMDVDGTTSHLHVQCSSTVSLHFRNQVHVGNICDNFGLSCAGFVLVGNWRFVPHTM